MEADGSGVKGRTRGCHGGPVRGSKVVCAVSGRSADWGSKVVPYTEVFTRSRVLGRMLRDEMRVMSRIPRWSVRV